MAFQYPYEIPGVSNQEFLKTAYNSLQQYRGLPEMDAVEFYRFLQDKLKVVEMDPAYLSRPLNDGFSGGEKKRNEILQMAVLEPDLAVLDETDSGPGHRRPENRSRWDQPASEPLEGRTSHYPLSEDARLR